MIGDLHRKFGHHKDAISSYQAALAIGSDWGIYAGLAQSYTQLNQTDEAIKNYHSRNQKVYAGNQHPYPKCAVHFDW